MSKGFFYVFYSATCIFIYKKWTAKSLAKDETHCYHEKYLRGRKMTLVHTSTTFMHYHVCWAILLRESTYFWDVTASLLIWKKRWIISRKQNPWDIILVLKPSILLIVWICWPDVNIWSLAVHVKRLKAELYNISNLCLWWQKQPLPLHTIHPVRFHLHQFIFSTIA